MFYKRLHHMFGTADSPSAAQNISNLYTTAYVHVEWWRALRQIISVEIWWKIRTGSWFSTPQHHTVSMNLKIPTTIKPLKLNCTIAQKADERAEAFRWKRRWRSCRWISRSLSSKDHLTSALCWTPWFIFIKLTYELNSNLIWQKNIY